MSKQTFAINGFGRIGRLAFRIWLDRHQDRLDLRVINTSGSMNIADWLHLVKHDSVYGVLPHKISYKETRPASDCDETHIEMGYFKIGDHKIIITAQRDPKLIPWDKYEVETVLEATGQFNKPAKAQAHLDAGAKRVLLSAPAKSDKEGVVSTSVIGVNAFDKSKQIFSNASCTTNCVAPVVKIIEEKFGIHKAVLNTIHAYTDDQNLHDNSHKKDLRRARNAALNMVPTSTGAAQATAAIIPKLKGKFDGLAIRVPTPVVSIADITMVTQKPTSIDKVNQALTEASRITYKGVVAVSQAPLVSSDFIGCEYSAVVDLPLTQVVDGDLVKIIAWYDNEWGYTVRLMEQLRRL